MPSNEELELLTGKGATGGSGDPEVDRRLCQRLASIIDCPDKQVLAFVRTRDPVQVNKIEKVLDAMPSTSSSRPATGAARSSRSGAIAASASAPELRCSTASAWPPSREMSQRRLQDMCTMSTSYSDVFNRTPGGPSNKSLPAAFDGIVRPDYRRTFDSWKDDKASDNDVRIFAEACRAIRFVGSKTGAPPTSYGAQFPHYGVVKVQPSSVHPLAAQVSNVPLGNLGAKSKREVKMMEEKHALHQRQITAAVKGQHHITSGNALTHEARQKLSVSVNFASCVIPPEGTMKAGENQGVPAGADTWKSASKESWTTQRDGKMENVRHKPRGMLESQQKHKLHSLAHEAYHSGEDVRNLSHTGVFCVSNPKDKSGVKVSRFTYAKFG